MLYSRQYVPPSAVSPPQRDRHRHLVRSPQGPGACAALQQQALVRSVQCSACRRPEPSTHNTHPPRPATSTSSRAAAAPSHLPYPTSPPHHAVRAACAGSNVAALQTEAVLDVLTDGGWVGRAPAAPSPHTHTAAAPRWRPSQESMQSIVLLHEYRSRVTTEATPVLGVLVCGGGGVHVPRRPVSKGTRAR